MVLVDLPGVQRPRDSLTERMQRRVERELADADAALLVIDGAQGVGPGDRFIAKALLGAGATTPVICAVNKCDRLGPPATAAALAAAAELEAWTRCSRSAPRRARASSRWSAHLAAAAARGPAALPVRGSLRPAQRGAPRRADPRAGASANPRRGAACGRGDRLRGREARGRHGRGRRAGLGRDPITEGHPDREGRADGARGGHRRPHELERDLGQRVFLDLRVRVREHWRRDDGLLDRIGI